MDISHTSTICVSVSGVRSFGISGKQLTAYWCNKQLAVRFPFDNNRTVCVKSDEVRKTVAISKRLNEIWHEDLEKCKREMKWINVRNFFPFFCLLHLFAEKWKQWKKVNEFAYIYEDDARAPSGCYMLGNT